MKKLIISLIGVFLFALGSSPGADLTADWDPAPDTNIYTDSATTEYDVGHLVAWGDDSHSECRVLDGRDFVAIAAGGSHNIALKTDGTLVAWGDNTCCQCSSTPVGAGFVAISAGDRHNLAMKSDGTLTAWGDNTWGQLNTPPGYNYIAIAAGNYHNLALHSDGWLAAWGKDEYGQCRYTPPGTDFVAVAAGR